MIDHTTTLVADAFRTSRDQAAPLAKLVQDKTNGNPFFVCQFLRTITQEKLVHFDYADRKWRWSMEQLYSAQYMDNVVDFMIAKVRKLPEATQKMVQLGACLGNTFSTEELAIVAECTLSDAGKQLSVAVAAGFLHVLLPIDPTDAWKEGVSSKSLAASVNTPTEVTDNSDSEQENTFLKKKSIAEDSGDISSLPHRSPAHSPPSTPTYHSPTSIEASEAKYKFVHDRVQEAFYVMVDMEERKQIHLKIARLLQAKGDVDENTETLFTIVHHYNLAVDLVLALPADSDDRVRLVSLNYQAARKAKHSNAIEPARVYLLHARRALPQNCFETNYEQTFGLLLLLAETEYVCGEHKEAYSLFDLLQEKGKNKKEKARVYILAAQCYESAGKFQECIQSCKQAGLLFGVQLPEKPTEQLVRQYIDEIYAAQKEKTATLAELGNLPFMDEEHQIVMEALYCSIAGAYIDSHESKGHHLFFIITGTMCKLTIQYGLSPFSANAFACFAGALAAASLPVYEFGSVAMKMHARLKVSSHCNFNKFSNLSMTASS